MPHDSPNDNTDNSIERAMARIRALPAPAPLSAEQRSARIRQYVLDKITARYVAEDQAGHMPRIEDFIARYPVFEDDLRVFALDYYLMGC